MPQFNHKARLQTAGHAGKSLLFPRRHLQVRQGLRTDMATPVPLRGSPPKLRLFFLKRKRIVPAMCGYLPTGRRLWSTGRLDGGATDVRCRFPIHRTGWFQLILNNRSKSEYSGNLFCNLNQESSGASQIEAQNRRGRDDFGCAIHRTSANHPDGIWNG